MSKTDIIQPRYRFLTSAQVLELGAVRLIVSQCSQRRIHDSATSALRGKDDSSLTLL
jgi:hypothetical protein